MESRLAPMTLAVMVFRRLDASAFAGLGIGSK